MKILTNYLTCTLACLSFVITAYSQSPSDAIMMKSRQACVLLDYNYSSFNNYWEGELKRENQTIATVYRHSILPMVAIGIFDQLNFYVGVPFIKTASTNPNGGKFAGVSGFQDLTMAFKYRLLFKELNSGALSALATVGFSTPITNYLPDYMPYSIGLGAPELSYRAIFQYKLNSGWYLRTTGSYLWRGYAEAEREYYYNDGSYYTSWMDVPNAISIAGVVGKWFSKDKLQIELNYFSSISLSGDDIRAYNAAQPTNDVDMGGVGLFVHYFFPQINGLGVVAYQNHTLWGRNSAQLNTTGIGITYFFNYLNKKNAEK